MCKCNQCYDFHRVHIWMILRPESADNVYCLHRLGQLTFTNNAVSHSMSITTNSQAGFDWYWYLSVWIDVQYISVHALQFTFTCPFFSRFADSMVIVHGSISSYLYIIIYYIYIIFFVYYILYYILYYSYYLSIVRTVVDLVQLEAEKKTLTWGRASSCVFSWKSLIGLLV